MSTPVPDRAFDPVAEQASRKDEHVALAVGLQPAERPNGFDDVAFMHHALPGTSVRQVDTSTMVCGVRWQLPIYINAMTGGTEATGRLNADLARAAAGAGMAIACGSQHIALRESARADSFSIIRREAPDAFVLANVGPTVSPEAAQRAVDMVEANALQIHLNVAQELVMPEGDRDFTDWAERIAAITAAVQVPVIVKEVGFGLSRRTIAALAAVGVAAADVAGAGGTDFITIENSRRDAQEYSYLTGWGQSAVLCLLEALDGPAPVQLPLLASGGVRTPLDALRALALGAQAVGVSGHFLRTLVARGASALEAELGAWAEQLRTLMTLVGADDVASLRRTDLLVTGATAERARLLGVDLAALARRSTR
ncbi:type 2 isopentenyl-diphosphate Delta-isomerase [Actinomyces sp. MRS3W]|uniref:type 2 isopentenyl-diphosphate Delta-isomerase n=1 Tax=Actinomyces sp. MRS3W TaxID=2800796 RepID=UPI0028FDBA53|nr:type 2 isopentenyl-diphosphate Delta-isomerase [Actinomyces sp. MRS3W]MDU0348062.1 type 2 isopentenyl-diphosphate Delta-isomerase [Actinomyces sp. MRS3W]